MTLVGEILVETGKMVEERKREVPLYKLPKRTSEPMSLARAIKRCPHVPVIAEVKPKSPYAGVLRLHPDVPALARAYEVGGAVAISVLTEPKYFGGSLEALVVAKESVGLPVLRKDFIIDEYQIHESLAFGADALLLIVSCIGEKLSELLSLAEDLGLEALVECHSKSEVERAVEAGAELIGLNNRDLKTLRVDLEVTKKLAKYVPPDRIVVSESGIGGAEDVEFLLRSGAKAVLVGTALMRASKPERKLAELTRRRGG